MIKKVIYELLNDKEEQNKSNNYVEYIIITMIILNVFLIILKSVNDLNLKYSKPIEVLEKIFFIFFLLEYLLKLWVANENTKNISYPRWKYIFSFDAIINLLALTTVMFGKFYVDFRVFRVLRLFKITQVKQLQQYTNIILKVLKLKKNQLLSSMLVVLIFLLTCSTIIYDLENQAQPEAFNNIVTSLWWSVSTITTIGYGDIYPITVAGRTFASVISLLGLFIMAIPIGILSAGFFDISKSVDNQVENYKK